MKLVFSALFLLSLIACSKADLKSNDETQNIKGCKSSIKATVKKQQLNESGTEFFYYLALEENLLGSYVVFATSLDHHLQVEGKRIEVKYNTTSNTYRFLSCQAGNSYDPANVDDYTMPIIEVCSASPTL